MQPSMQPSVKESLFPKKRDVVSAHVTISRSPTRRADHRRLKRLQAPKHYRQ